MKKYIATLRVEIEAESIEARDYVAEMLAISITRKRVGANFLDVGAALVRKAAVSRVRPKK